MAHTLCICCWSNPGIHRIKVALPCKVAKASLDSHALLGVWAAGQKHQAVATNSLQEDETRTHQSVFNCGVHEFVVVDQLASMCIDNEGSKSL
jgi:hypothetical protein